MANEKKVRHTAAVDASIEAEWQENKFIVTMEVKNPRALEGVPEEVRDSMTMTVMAHALLEKASEIRKEAGLEKDWQVEAHKVKPDDAKIH